MRVYRCMDENGAFYAIGHSSADGKYASLGRHIVTAKDGLPCNMAGDVSFSSDYMIHLRKIRFPRDVGFRTCVLRTQDNEWSDDLAELPAEIRLYVAEESLGALTLTSTQGVAVSYRMSDGRVVHHESYQALADWMRSNPLQGTDNRGAIIVTGGGDLYTVLSPTYTSHRISHYSGALLDLVPKSVERGANLVLQFRAWNLLCQRREVLDATVKIIGYDIDTGEFTVNSALRRGHNSYLSSVVASVVRNNGFAMNVTEQDYLYYGVESI